MTWEIRRAAPGAASELSAIALAAKRHWGYPETWIEEWRDDLTVSPTFIENESVFVAVGSHSKIVGFYALCHVNTDAEMEHFWVRPEVMGRGVGRALFEHAVAQLRAVGCRSLQIDADPHAAGFYERMGAELVGTVSASMDGRPRVRPQYKLDVRCLTHLSSWL